jgi:predicted nucleotidyltransferase
MLTDTATLAELGLARANALNKLCEHYGVRQLDIFGSAARQHDFGQDSDIDLLVQFKPSANKAQQYFGFLEALEALLARKVDLIEASALRNPYVLASIEQDRQTLYAAT